MKSVSSIDESSVIGAPMVPAVPVGTAMLEVMDIDALIIGAIIGGAAGGIGYLAALAAQRFWRLRSPPYWVVAASTIVGIAGGTALMNGWSPLHWDEQRIAVDDVLPFMHLIKAREPNLYERIETSVIRDQNDGIPTEQVRANARSLVMSYVADKTTFLPDDITYELFATTRDQLAFLAENREFKVCADLALGRAKGDLDSKLSKELVERDNNNAMRVISTPPNDGVRKMPAEEFSQLATRAFADASQATNVAPNELDDLLAGTGDPAKTCKLMKAFFDAILAQPVDVAASALRTMSLGERTTTQ